MVLLDWSRLRGYCTRDLITVPKPLGNGTVVPGLCLVVFALTDGGNASGGWRTLRILVTFTIGGLFVSAAVYVEGWVSKRPLLSAELFRTKYMRRIAFALLCPYDVFGLILF